MATPKKPTNGPAAGYTAEVGVNYPGPDGIERRVEAGDPCEGLSARDAAALLEMGAIRRDG